MKKLFIFLFIVAFVFVGCSQPTSSTFDEPTTTPTTVTTPDNGDDNNNGEDNNGGETPDNGNGGEENNSEDENNNNGNNSGSGNGNENGGNQSNPDPDPINNDPVVVTPTIHFRSSESTVDIDSVIYIDWENYDRTIYNGYAWTYDGSEPTISSNRGSTIDMTSTYFHPDFIAAIRRGEITSFTIRAKPYKQVNARTVNYGEEISKTFTVNRYTVTYTSSKPCGNHLPSVETVTSGTTYTLSRGFCRPEGEGYWFDGWKINGTRYEPNSTIEVRSNVVIEAVYRAWSYDYTPIENIPENYTNVDCTNSLDTMTKYSTFVIRNNGFVFKIILEHNTISSYTENGHSYVKCSGYISMHYTEEGSDIGNRRFNYDSKTGYLTTAKNSRNEVYNIPILTNLNWIAYPNVNNSTCYSTCDILYCDTTLFYNMSLR